MAKKKIKEAPELKEMVEKIPEITKFKPKDVWDFEGRDLSKKYSYIRVDDGNTLRLAAERGYKAASGKEDPKVKGNYLLMCCSKDEYDARKNKK